MIRKRVKLSKKMREEKRSINYSNKDSKLLDKNKVFAYKECLRNLTLKKRTIIKKDGRYLIYYTF